MTTENTNPETDNDNEPETDEPELRPRWVRPPKKRDENFIYYARRKGRPVRIAGGKRRRR